MITVKLMMKTDPKTYRCAVVFPEPQTFRVIGLEDEGQYRPFNHIIVAGGRGLTEQVVFRKNIEQIVQAEKEKMGDDFNPLALRDRLLDPAYKETVYYAQLLTASRAYQTKS